MSAAKALPAVAPAVAAVPDKPKAGADAKAAAAKPDAKAKPVIKTPSTPTVYPSANVWYKILCQAGSGQYWNVELPNKPGAGNYVVSTNHQAQGDSQLFSLNSDPSGGGAFSIQCKALVAENRWMCIGNNNDLFAGDPGAYNTFQMVPVFDNNQLFNIIDCNFSRFLHFNYLDGGRYIDLGQDPLNTQYMTFQFEAQPT